MQSYHRTFRFAEIGFMPSMVNGWRVREANSLVSDITFYTMCEEMPELRAHDIELFEFDIDWVGHKVYVTEREYEFDY